MKYEIFDRVRVLDGSRLKDYSGGWLPEMSSFVGAEGTVVDIDTFHNKGVFIDFDDFEMRQAQRDICGLDDYLAFDTRALEPIGNDFSGEIEVRLIGDPDPIADLKALLDDIKRNLPHDWPEPRFKEGDRVRILDGNNLKDYSGGWVPTMSDLVGNTGIVELVLPRVDSVGWAYRLRGIGYMWDERGLEEVSKIDR